MGCEQSDTGNIVIPVGQVPIEHLTVPVPSSSPSITSKKNRNNQAQVNDMPNDEFHFEWFDRAKALCNQKKLEQAEKIADEFFENGYIDEAVEIYQKIISTDPHYKNDIEGLGCPQLTVSYYEWFIYRCYDERRKTGKIKSSPYDALSLCYTLLMGNKKYATALKKGLVWYQSMLMKNPDNIGILMGYGNLFACSNSFDEAIKMYDRVIQLRPDFVNAYASKAVLHEYKRINLKKASEIATKILTITDSNPYADFILARNVVDIDQKIVRLKEAALIHPDFARIVNEVGICYGGKKNDYDQAIEWYKKSIEIASQYHSSYNNIGVNYELKQNYQEARKWYYKAIQLRKDYVAPHQNVTDVYMTLGWSHEQIEAEIQLHEKIDKATFYYNIGKAYYNKGNNSLEQAVYWGEKAVQVNPNEFDFWNSLGITYDEKGLRQKAIEMYKKCIELNPQYEIAYYNIALAYKALNRLDETQKYYRKSVEINPKYSYAWNNLGNLFKNRDEPQQAIDCYQHAVEYNSTYTLALTNLGICLLKVKKFKEAFQVFSRAKENLPNDNNNLSEGNKTFLSQQLKLFDTEGEKWKKTGTITDEEKQTLKMLIEQFENKFKNIAAAIKTLNMPSQKIFNPQILQIIKILNEDKFQLQKIQEIFELVESIFHEDEQYFHIIPLLIIEKFTSNVFQKNKPIMQTESELTELMKKIALRVNQKQNNAPSQLVKSVEIKLTECKPLNQEVDLFKQTAYFNDYEELYIAVNNVNNEAKKSYTDFCLLVEEVRKKSNGMPAGISTKIPAKYSEQFKVMLRITQKMFKKELDKSRTTNIINTINSNLKAVKSPSLEVVVKEIMSAWNKEISNILVYKSTQKIETKFTISDLIRGKCVYNTVEDLLKAVRVVDGYCKVMGYDIVELDNRLMKPQTQDVVLKVRINDAVCELQLAMKQNEVLTHLDHCVYEILRSPLGVIFGSYLFMSKEVKYPLTANCKDISEKLVNNTEESMILVKACADYVLKALQTIKK